MIDALSMLTAALCGVLAYHAHFTAKRLQTDSDAARSRIASTETLCQVLRGELAELATRLHAVDRDTQALCANTGVKRYSGDR